MFPHLGLDDYHVINAKSIDVALTFLIEHMPPQMHLIIATREDPSLPLARLRARGQLTELRVAEFLNQVMGLSLSAADIAASDTHPRAKSRCTRRAQFACNNLTCDHLVTYNTDMEDEAVFRALADPSRRRLLDLLFERDGRTLTELESELPMTRFGVMKHLRVLEEAGLIATRKVGREKLHYLNPVPIQLISDRWINKYSAVRASALADLKTVLEGENVMTTDSKPRLVYEIIIKASQQRVWEAITKPEFTSRYYYGSTLKTDLTVGSPFTYHIPNGSPIVEGEVVSSDPPNRLVHTYHSLWPPMNEDAPTTVTWELESMPGGITKVTVVHEDFQGETATYQGLQSGGWTWILSNMKTLLETGEPMPQEY